MTADELNELGKRIADRSGWSPDTDHYARIWQAAMAGAVEAEKFLTTLKDTPAS